MSHSTENSEAILLLDDDRHFRQLIVKLLTFAGHQTLEAQNAMEATSLVSRTTPALAIVDYRLPGMDGLAWIEQMRASGIKLPMVLLTSAKMDANQVKRLKEALNVPLVFQKPINPAVFLQDIQSLLPKTLKAEGVSNSPSRE